MANKYIKLLLLLILVAGILFGLKYFSVGQNVGDFPVVDFSKSGEGTSEPIDYEVVEVVRGLFVPWSIVFTSDNRILVSERSGAIRVVENGKLLDKPLISFSVSSEAEDGLMGIELDPDYEENKLLYACYSYEKGGGLANRVVQIVDDGASASVQKVVIEDFPAAQVHAGCRIKFGPEGKLYITVGDAREKTLAQDLDSLAGKILRLNSDGSIPTDNPFYPSPIYSYGHRNPQGIDWDKNGVLYQTEHGPSTFDGPPGGDEVNKIEAGKNYGWPVVSHDKSKEGMADPLLVYTPAVAPASALVYSGKFIPQFAGDLFFGGLRGEGLYRVSLKGGSAENLGKVNGVDFGRIRDVVEAPNGEIYFTTSNRDGRGTVQDGDDKLYKIVQKRKKAGFVIYTNGTRRDFSDQRYHNLSEKVYIESTNPNQIIFTGDTTWGEFFETLPMKLTKECLTTGTGQEFCTGASGKLAFYLDGVLKENVLDMEIKDGGVLLVSFGPENNPAIEKQVEDSLGIF